MATRIVISKSTKKRAMPKGSKMYNHSEMVVYKTKLANGNYHSQTKHEIKNR